MKYKNTLNFTNLCLFTFFLLSIYCLFCFDNVIYAQGNSELDTIWENYPWSYSTPVELPVSNPTPVSSPSFPISELPDTSRPILPNSRITRIGNPSHYPGTIQSQQNTYIPYRPGAEYIPYGYGAQYAPGRGLCYELPAVSANNTNPAELASNNYYPVELASNHNNTMNNPDLIAYSTRDSAEINSLSVEASSYYSDEYQVNFSQPKSGLFGKLKVGFGYLDSRLEEIYIKYHDRAKRKLYWKVWEKNRGNFSSYKDFKRDWDTNTDIWKEIKNELKKDIKSEVDGLLRTKRPFDNHRPIRNGRRGFIENMLS